MTLIGLARLLETTRSQIFAEIVEFTVQITDFISNKENNEIKTEFSALNQIKLETLSNKHVSPLHSNT